MEQKNLRPKKVIKVNIENSHEEPVLVEAINRADFSVREFNVFAQYFYSGKSHQKIGEKLGVCKKRVIFLKKKAVNKMKETMPEFPHRLFKERRRKLLAAEIIRKKQEKQSKQGREL